MNTRAKDAANPRLNTIFLGVAFFWSIVIVALAAWNYWQSYTATVEIARSSAYESYSKDLVYRRWATTLEPSGGNETYFRFMRPLITEAGCLKCHMAQGYKVGDIRGGISVSLPWGPFHKALLAQMFVIILTYGLIWVIGLMGLYLGRNQLQHYLSARKQAETAVLSESEFNRLVIENAGQGICVCHEIQEFPYLRFTVWNEHMTSITGYSIAEINRLGWYQRMYPDPAVQERAIMRMQSMHVGDDIQGEEWEITRADGQKRQLFITTRLHTDMNNKPFVLGVMSDITERKRAEEENRDLQERLQRSEKMESLGTLAGGVAHDLNNVLGIVVGYSEMLLDQVDKSSPLRHGLENVMNGGLKAAAIVEDLLTLARRGVQGRSILNLNEIVSDCQQSPEFTNLSSHHPSVKIKTDLETDLPNISGSSVHLGKTLYNLISNASEAVPKGGTVTIKTTNQYLDKPIQGYDQIREGDYVVLSVSDTGEGISAHDLRRIFEPFYTKKVMGRSGTGLGLAVVWGTMKDHSGYIDVQSEEGKGSAFTLYFPVTGEEITTEASAAAISEYMGKGETILVVDDIKEQRDLAATILKTLNYNVSTVSSGEEAVAYLKEREVDLLVLDMIMDPGMDGLDTYKSVLAIHPKQKAIIASGFSESDRVKATRGLGAGAYVRKPYIKEKLGLAVRKELDRK